MIFYYDHRKGEGPTERAQRAGYVCRKDYGSYYLEGVAENIYLSDLYLTAANQARQTVQSWMDSPGHRINLLDVRFDKEGIGVALVGGQLYITQNFC